MSNNDLVCLVCGCQHNPAVDCRERGICDQCLCTKDDLICTDGAFCVCGSCRNTPANDTKKDSDKIDYTLIPPEVLKLAAKLLTTGAKIHGADSWKTRSDSRDRQLKSLYRHLEARRAGNYYDDSEGGTGSLHSVAVLVNAIMLVYFDIQETWYDEKLGGVNEY